VILQLNPFAVSWLAAKLALLVAYIVFGILALRRAPTLAGKLVCYVIALLCFTTMVSIARSHDPLGWLRMFAGAAA
ncbi:MAG TPA: SirB2 family protein, partial [Burkholderiaceae bacterium]|nr:SirB2 family protein [Burkholderiaceae bacterium]